MSTRSLKLPNGQTLTYCKLSKILTIQVDTSNAIAVVLTSDYWSIQIGLNHRIAFLTVGNREGLRLGCVNSLKARIELFNFITDCFQHAHSTSPKSLTF